MDEDFLNTIINEFIKKNKVNKFIKLLEEYNYDTSNLTYINEEKIINNKIPLDILKERLVGNKEELEKNLKLTFDDILKQCDLYEYRIRKHELAGKKYYYYFCLYLSHLKQLMLIEGYTPHAINIFIEERYYIKISTINKYIRFNKLCGKYPQLLNCDLVYKEIMQNIPEIEKLLT